MAFGSGVGAEDETFDEAAGESGEPRAVEHRLIGRLLDEWRALGGHQAPPPLGRIDAAALGDIWDWCYVLDLEATGGEPCILQAGPALIEAAGGAELAGPLSALPAASLIAQSVRAWRQVVERRVPVATGGAFLDAAGRQMRYRSVLLPLSEDGRTIHRLLGAANGRVMVDE